VKDPKLLTSQVGSGSQTRRKMGSGSKTKVSDPQHWFILLSRQQSPVKEDSIHNSLDLERS
jgi:hypothetical protein